MTSNRQTIRTDVLEKKFSKSQQIQNEPIQKSSPVNYCIVTNFDSNGKTRQWSKMNGRNHSHDFGECIYSNQCWIDGALTVISQNINQI